MVVQEVPLKLFPKALCSSSCLHPSRPEFIVMSIEDSNKLLVQVSSVLFSKDQQEL
ncbi:hypothetical protein DY000_02011913 [Brassica cretica]|uniref:Uncharacterized protein n=1 Tax=Brassica cretica TaxID=69181 RepID=A0ABQ7CYK3_BRACR|nr:hypothetical protein DY000_02011913 [Brassica cretica]